MTLFLMRTTDFPFVEVEIVRGIIYFCGKPRRIAIYQSKLFQTCVRKCLLLLLIPDYFVLFIVSPLSFHYFVSFFVPCNKFLTITSLPSYRFLRLFRDTWVSLLLQFTLPFILLYLQSSGICFNVSLHSTLLLLFRIFFLYNPTLFFSSVA